MNKNGGGRYAVKTAEYGVFRWIILIALLSFIGWAYETAYLFLCSGTFQDRGFMTLPFCPIYGVSIASAYFLLGTPDGAEKGERQGVLLQNAERKWARYGLYLLFTFLIPSIAELLVGAFFDGVFSLSLWDYSGIPLNIYGYVCAPISLAWSGMLFLFMKYLFMPLKNFVGKLSKPMSAALAIALSVGGAIDLIVNFARLI